MEPNIKLHSQFLCKGLESYGAYFFLMEYNKKKPSCCDGSSITNTPLFHFTLYKG